MVVEKVENEITIKLVNGLITGKSGLNLRKLVSQMDTNLKNALTLIMLENMGLTLNDEGESIIFDELKGALFAEWFYNKVQYKNNNSILKNAIKKQSFARAEEL
jgi:hypothetical protein